MVLPGYLCVQLQYISSQLGLQLLMLGFTSGSHHLICSSCLYEAAVSSVLLSEVVEASIQNNNILVETKLLETLLQLGSRCRASLKTAAGQTVEIFFAEFIIRGFARILYTGMPCYCLRWLYIQLLHTGVSDLNNSHTLELYDS